MANQRVFVIAFLALIVGNFAATWVDVLVKVLATDVSAYQYIFLRHLGMLLVLLPFWLKLPKTLRKSGNLKVHGFRAVLTIIGSPCAVMALLYLPLATANVIFYSAPLFTVLFARWIFKEKLKRHRMIVLILGFSGVIMAFRPEYIDWYGFLAFVTAFCVACYNLSVKWLPADSPSTNTMFWSCLVTLPLTGLAALPNWQPISSDLLLLAFGACLMLIVYQASCVYAFHRVEAGAISVAEYSGLVFAALLGSLLFNEPLDGWTIAGILLILLPITWQSLYESGAHHRLFKTRRLS